VQIAAQDAGRLSRTIGACAGATVAGCSVLALLALRGDVPLPVLTSSPAALSPTMAVALGAAGLALLLLAPAAPGGLRRRAGHLLAALAAAIGAACLIDSLTRADLTSAMDRTLAGAGSLTAPAAPAAALAVLLAGTALAVIDMRWHRPPTPRWGRRSTDVPGSDEDPALTGGDNRTGTTLRIADPLFAGVAIIALVALVPRMFAPTFPGNADPGGVISAYVAVALLALAVGAVLARPGQGPLRTSADAGPAATVRRRLTPALIALPFAAALVSALAARTGIGRPAAAISTGAILAAMGLLALIAHLVRSLEGADRRQRLLVADLNDRQEFADTLLQSMNEAVMVLDANHRVIDVNRRWRELTGHRTEDAVGQQPPYPWGPDAGTGDRVLQRRDGTPVPVLATMAAVPDAAGLPRAYVATYVDIADRKEAEEALSAHAAELELSNLQLREANSSLETALTFKSDLMSMLSHDVAQPISSIASLSELLTSDWADLPEDIRLELATKIDRNTTRLIRMMNDLQLLFRLDAGSVTARRTPVPMREVVETVAASASAEGLEIVIDDRVSALADRGHVWHVVQNLLSNAVKYGIAPIEIRATQEADGVVLVVQDQGAGIPEELVPNLFDRFMRGAGLGLFIVRHLVEANGGTVRYERVEPHGARLVVTWESANITVPGAAEGAGDRV
jgi:signal transduction histidine kinase